MSKINLTTMMVGALIVVLTGSARAKTVALWPIEWNEGTLYFDVHCRIDSANDFSVNNLTREDVKVLGTELPPRCSLR